MDPNKLIELSPTTRSDASSRTTLSLSPYPRTPNASMFSEGKSPRNGSTFSSMFSSRFGSFIESKRSSGPQQSLGSKTLLTSNQPTEYNPSLQSYQQLQESQPSERFDRSRTLSVPSASHRKSTRPSSMSRRSTTTQWNSLRNRYSSVKSIHAGIDLCRKDSSGMETSKKPFINVADAMNPQNTEVTWKSVAWLQDALKNSRPRFNVVRYMDNRKSILPSKDRDHCPRITLHPPLFDNRRPTTTRQIYDFERKQFQDTMESMGKLKPIGAKAPPKDAGPYHCSTANDFKREQTVLKRLRKKEKTKTKRPCKTIGLQDIPSYVPFRTKNKSYFDPGLLTNKRPMQEPYFPKSTVRVRYPGRLDGQAKPSDSDVRRNICKHMAGFGPMLAVVSEGKNTVLVIYEFMKSAYKSRVSTQHPTGVTVEWLNCKFENFGHISQYLDYAVSKDKVWQDCVKDKTKFKSLLNSRIPEQQVEIRLNDTDP